MQSPQWDIPLSESTRSNDFSRPHSAASTISSTVTPRSKAKRSKVTPDDILCKVNEKLNEEKVDDFDMVGKVVANKLRKLPAGTATIAEKFILDILFEAQLGNIDRYSKLNITQTVPVHQQPLEQPPLFTVSTPVDTYVPEGQQLEHPRVFNVLNVERNVSEEQLFNTATYLSQFKPN